MKKKAIAVGAVFAGLLSVTSLLGVELERPTANLTENFTNSSGWTSQAPSSVVAGWSTNEWIQVKYPLRSSTSFSTELADLKGDTNASLGIFTGDLSAMESVSLNVKARDLEVTPALYYRSSTGAKWYISLSGMTGLGSDVWGRIDVPLSFNADTSLCWSKPSGRSQADFNGDIKNVTEIGFSTARSGNGNNAQDFSVDNVKLIGPWGTNLVDGVPVGWALEYGLTNNIETVGHQDSDSDGFTNFAEFLAGTDPNADSSFFRVEIGRNERGNIEVKWKDNKYMKFDLLESTNLVTFSLVDGATGITGVGTQQVVEVNNADLTGVRFYKVQIRQ